MHLLNDFSPKKTPTVFKIHRDQQSSLKLINENINNNVPFTASLDDLELDESVDRGISICVSFQLLKIIWLLVLERYEVDEIDPKLEGILEHQLVHCDDLGLPTGDWLMRLSFTLFRECVELFSFNSGFSVEFFLSTEFCFELKNTWTETSGYVLQIPRTPFGIVPGVLCKLRADGTDILMMILSNLIISDTKLNHHDEEIRGNLQNYRLISLLKNNNSLFKLTPYLYATESSNKSECSEDESESFIRAVELWFTKAEIGFIIGSKGDRIKEIRQKSGATIKIFAAITVLNETLLTANTQRPMQRVAIQGNRFQIRYAQYLLNKLLCQKTEGVLKS